MANIFDLLDSNEIDALQALIDRLDSSSFDYMKIQGGELNITIGKNGYQDEIVSTPAPAAAIAPTPAPAATPAAIPAAAPAEAPAAEVAPAKVEKKPVAQDNLHYIKCPSYGLFYAQPEPGAPAYVTPGCHLNVGDTVGLLEIMKTYTAIVTDIAGTVTEVLVNNQDAVEPGQLLFVIDPA